MPQVIVAAALKVYSVGLATIGAVAGASAAATASTFAVMAAGTATIVAAGAALNAAMKGLMPDLSMPQADNDKTRQQTVRGTIEPQKVVYGEALVSGPIFFVGLGGPSNELLYHSIALTGHECQDITDVHFDNEVITDAQIDSDFRVTAGAYGPVGSGGLGNIICKINRRIGASDQTYDTLLDNFVGANWSTAHRTRGISTITTEWKLNSLSQEVWDRLKPQNIKALVKGKKDIYDPRLDTSAGANPSNTSYQQWTDNPALCVANYLTDTKFGLSIPTSKIDWDAVETAADACDVTVTVPDSGTQKRFTANGVLFATDTHRANINKLLSAMNGSLVYSNGIYTIRAGIYEAPTESLTEDDLAGAVTVRTSVERGNRFNTVKPIFIDPTQNHKSVEAPVVSITAAINRDNGEALRRDIELPFTNSSYMAQRIAHKQIQMSDQQKVITFPANLTGLRVDVGDRVNVTISELNYSNKVFRCAGWSFSDTDDGVVNLTLLEDDAGSYADPTASEYSTIAPDGTITEAFRGVPDPQNLSATAGLKNIELNWTNPVNTSQFKEIVIYASPDSSWANKVEIGRTMGTQFIHDASNSADPLAVGDTRYYWIRALAYGAGSGSFVESDRNPDSDTSNIVATVGPNNPDYSDIVDDTPAQAAPTALTLTETTVLGNDGSVLPAVRVSWTAPTDNTYVSFYEVEFKQTSQGEVDYGQVSDSYNQTINYGSVADATTLELNYGGVNEAISGASADFSSINVYGTSTVIAGMKELEEFTFRVRAVTLTGKTSGFITEFLTLQGDQTAPAIPSSITATGGIQQIKLNYELPSDSDLAYVEIFENTVNNLSSASLIVKTKSDQHTVTGLGNNATRYYWLRSADRSGNLSGYSSAFSATTQKIVLDDLAQSVLDQFAEGDAFGIEPVSTLSGVTGDHVGQVKLLTTTNTLYVWTGSAWSTDLFTASNVDPGSITAASFASGVEPISAVNTLPSPTGYTGPSLVFLTTDSKVYRYDSSVPEFTTLVNTTDLSGTLAEDLFSDTIRPIERVGTLPTTGLTTGRVVMLTTDGKLYRYNGTSWTSAISAADLDDQLNLATQASGLLPVANAASGLVNSNVTINADGTLSGAGTGQATLTGLGGGAVATLDTITEAYIGSNSISSAKIQANAITANEILAGSVTAAKIAAGAIVSEKIAANAITAAKISAGAVTANEIASGAVSADAIAANAITAEKIAANSVSASEIVAGSITSSEINTSQIFSDSAVIGAIQASAITAAAIDAAVANFEFVESVNIASDAVTAGKIDVSSLSAISANLGTVNAGNINAAQVSVYNLNGGNISSGTVPTARLDVAGIITAGSIIVSNDDISNLNNNAGYVDSSGAASAAPVQSVAGSTGNVSAQTIITAGGIAVTSDIPTAVSELSNDSAFVNAAGASAAAPIQSVAGATGNVSAQTIITAGGIAVTSDIPTAVSELANDSAYVNASGASAAAPVQSVAGATGAVSASTIITAGNIAVTADLPTAVSELTNDSGYVDSAGAASAAPVQSVAGATGTVSVSTIISAGSIVVQGDNISDLTNDSAFINGGQVNSNVTAISGGVITTGTINANRINIDNVTLDTDGSGQLIIHASGVDTPQIAANAVTNTEAQELSSSVTWGNTNDKIIMTLTFTGSGQQAEIYCEYIIGGPGANSHSGILKHNGTVERSSIRQGGSNTITALVTTTNGSNTAQLVINTTGSTAIVPYAYIRELEVKR